MIAKLHKKQHVTEGTLRADFKLPKPVAFKAGQYTTITLLNPPYNDAQGHTRDFSLVNAPHENDIFSITTRIRDSAFKKSLVELPPGADVEIREPAGDLVLPEFLQEPLVFVAGGIGITPFMSMLKDLSYRVARVPITLFYSNSDKKTTPFLDEIDELSKKLPQFNPILIWTAEQGRVNADILAKNVSNLDSPFFYIAGAPGMVHDVFDMLISLNLNPMKIKSEDFAGY